MNIVNKQAVENLISELTVTPIKIEGFDPKLYYYTLSIERTVLNTVLKYALERGAGRHVHSFADLLQAGDYQRLTGVILSNSITIVNDRLKDHRVINNGLARITQLGPDRALIVIRVA